MIPALILAATASRPTAAPPASEPPAELAAPRADSVEDFKALEAELKLAQKAFRDKLRAAQKSGGKISQELRDSAPEKDFLPRFRAFADEYQGTEGGGRALLEVYDLAGSQNYGDLMERVGTELVAEYAEMAFMEEFAAGLRYAGYGIGKEAGETHLKALLEKNKQAGVQAACLFSLGSLYSEWETPDRSAEGRKLMDQLIASHPDTKYAASARGVILEAEHLQVGMLAPDFAIADESGLEWKLSDYRGKVAVIDFWGYW
jgi:hypothetical protein